jgi:hypothetical protein
MTYPLFQGIIPSLETCNKISPINQGVAVYGLYHAYGDVAAGTAIDFTFGQYQSISLSQNATLTIPTPPGACDILLRVVQTGAGGWTITWPAAAIYAAGTPNAFLTLNTTNAAAVDLISMHFDGVTWFISSYAMNIMRAPVSIAVTTVDSSLDPVQTSQCTATATYSDATTAVVTNSCAWLSSSPGNVSVGAVTGLATGVAVGAANITATMGTIVGTIPMTCN